jgi:hypothetical protein
MRVQALDKSSFPSSYFYKPVHILYDIKRICPFVTFSPTCIWAGPRAIRIFGLHETRIIVIDAEWIYDSTIAEKSSVRRFVEQVGQNGDSVIIIWGKECK